MESLVDIVTTSFQAVLAVAIVFTAGYALNSNQDAGFAKVRQIFPIPSSNAMADRQAISTTSRRMLLPALIFTTLATSSMTWRTFMMRKFSRARSRLTDRMANCNYRIDNPSFVASV